MNFKKEFHDYMTFPATCDGCLFIKNNWWWHEAECVTAPASVSLWYLAREN